MYGNRADRSKDSWQIEMRGIYIKIDMYIRYVYVKIATSLN